MRELISVIVPVYNVTEYLKRCVDSIIGQSYEHLEIILVDDGAEDGSGELCDTYAAKDSRIKVIHKKNGGLSSARNAALDVAEGTYIGFVDSDDYIHSRMFEKLYEACDRTHAQIAVCGHYTEKDTRLLIEEPMLDQEEILTRHKALELLIRDQEMRSYAWDKLYHASLFENIRYPDGRNYEDLATTYRLFDKAEQICRIPEYLYYYQIRQGSISYHITEEKWHRNCMDIVIGQRERYEYFKGDQKDLAALCLAQMVPYIYTFIDTGYKVKADRGMQEFKEYLQIKEKEIWENPFISHKDKRLLKIYCSGEILCRCYQKLKKPAKAAGSCVQKGKRLLHRCGVGMPHKYDFTLEEGKNIRLILFELPCFDNLGDHAISYAQEVFLKDIMQEYPQMQLYVIDGWDTVEAVNQLKRVIAPCDIVFCQGGGNLGNLYPFAEAFRKKILSAFKDQRMFIFPQTIYFTKDTAGEKSKADCRKIYGRCQNLTLCARDHHSFEIMSEVFGTNIDIIEVNDIVSYLDRPVHKEAKREGILLCLRSDMESALNAENKKKLQDICEVLTKQTKITDTVTGRETGRKDREMILIKKWELFAGAKLVVTDRLHGMIFSLITGTPCVVLGNNHHKVSAAYETFKECGYLYYADSPELAETLIKRAYAKALPEGRREAKDQFEMLKQRIAMGCQTD